MEGDKNKWGFIVLLRNGRTSPPYELDVGKHTIGSAADSNIRLRSSTSLLSTHAVITVNKLGVAIITNKSAGVPISVNDKHVYKTAVLHNGDKFTVVDKEFQYTNENLKDIPINSDIFQQAVAKSLKRTSVAPKTPVFKTNTPLKSTPLNQDVRISTRKSITNNSHHKTIASRVRKAVPLTPYTKRRFSLQTKRLEVESITEHKVNKRASTKSCRTSSSFVKPLESENIHSQELSLANCSNSAENNDNKTDLQLSKSLLPESDDDFSLHLSNSESEPRLYEPANTYSMFEESTQDRNYNSSRDGSRVVVVEEKRRSSRKSVFEDTMKTSESVSHASLDESTKDFNATESPAINGTFSNQNMSRRSRRSGILSPIEISSTLESSQNISLASSGLSRNHSQTSSLNSTISSQSESASPLKSISSQSFSSYKKVSTKTGDTVSETTEIDVVNITSTTLYTPENRRTRSKTSSAGKRVSTSMPTEKMFDELLCTSTPFHKLPLNIEEKLSVSDSVMAPKISPPKRRSSLRTSVAKKKHRCFSCGPEMPTSEPVVHRQSTIINVVDTTPEKSFKEETPKSHIKSVRRSTKSNQSTYNPVVEDITPVTPENLLVSNLNEKVFKTPINTPGLFESITKSVIRSKKRLRESYGSSLKANKKPKVEEAAVPLQPQNQQKSPANRLSDFVGVKKLMKSPAKSPKNDLTKIPNLRKLMSPKPQKSPVNDLSRNVSGTANLFNVSGIEVLHDESDIENSEDLFTNLTGKRPVRSYSDRRTRSLNIANERKSLENDNSRKTMGDLPLYSPRVAQWVDEHVNLSGQTLDNEDNIFDDQLLQKSDRRSKRGRKSSTGRNKILDNVNDEVANISQKRSERNSVNNNSSIMMKYEDQQSKNVTADFESVDVNNSHMEKSTRKSKTWVLNKSLKTPDQEEGFQESTRSSSRKSQLRRTTVNVETPDGKPRLSKAYSSQKKASSIGVKGFKDSLEKAATSFDTDQKSCNIDLLVDTTEVSNSCESMNVTARNESLDNVNDKVIINTSQKSREQNSVSSNCLVNSMTKYEQSKNVTADFESVDVNNSHEEKSIRKSKSRALNKSMKTPDLNQEDGFQDHTKSSSRNSYSETPDRKPRLTKGYSSKKKTPSTGVKKLKTQDSFEEGSTSFVTDEQSYNIDLLFNASDVSNSRESMKVKNELIDDNKLKRGKKAVHSVSPKKHSVRDASGRRRTVAEYPQSTVDTNQKQNRNSILLESTSTKTIDLQMPDSRNLRSSSPKKKASENATKRRTVVERSGDSSFGSTQSARNDSFYDENTVADNYNKIVKVTEVDFKTPIKKPKITKTVSLKKPTPTRSSKGRRRTVGNFGDGNYQKFEGDNTNNQQSAVSYGIEQSLLDDSAGSELDNINNSQNDLSPDNLSNDEDLFANIYDNNMKKIRMCHSVSPQKQSLRNSINRRKTVAQYPQLSVVSGQSIASESIVHENSDRQESDYSDEMANVSLDKRFKRRKGYSLNMLKKTTVSFNSRRTTFGAKNQKTPDVKSWKNLYRFTQQNKNISALSRRATTNFASITRPVSRDRRRSFGNFNSKKIVPNIDEWKMETVRITPSTSMLKNDSGKSNVPAEFSSRKIENEVPIKLDPNQLGLESENTKIVNKPVEVLRRTTRKRAVSKEDNLKLVEEPTKITPKRTTRRAKINENDINNEVLLEEPKKIIPTRKGRGKKMVTEGANTSTSANDKTPHFIEQLTTQDENPAKVLKSLDEMQTPVQNSAGRAGKHILSNEDIPESDEQVKISSIKVPTRATRKRKLNKDDLQENVDTLVLLESAPTVRSTRKLAKEDSTTVEQNSPVVASKATKKQNIVKPALLNLETEDTLKSTRDKTKSEPVKSRRGRSNKTNNSEAVKVEDEKAERSSVSGNENEAQVVPKRSTRRRKAVEEKTDKSTILAETPFAEKVLEPTSVKGALKREKQALAENKTVSTEEAVAEVKLKQVKPTRATRGNKAVPKSIAETVVPDEVLTVEDLKPVEPKKVMRGNKAVLKITDIPGENLEDQAPIIAKKATRSNKAVTENEPPLIEDPVAMKPKKTTRGKKTVSEITEAVENQVSSQKSGVQTKRTLRGKKAIQADAVTMQEEPIAADEAVDIPKVGKSTRSKRAQKDNNVQPDELEMKENVASRPHRRGVNNQESTDPPVRQTRSRKERKNEEVPQTEEESKDRVVNLKSRKGQKNEDPESSEESQKERQVTFNEHIGVKFMTPRLKQQRKNTRNVNHEEASDKEFEDVVFNKPLRASKRSKRQI